MLLVRPCHSSDLEAITALLERSGLRLSTLPRDPELLAERVQVSLESFAQSPSRQGKERLLFVLEYSPENPDSGRDIPQVVGLAGIDVCAGNGAPFYSYRRDELIHASHTLNVHNRIPVLYLTHELTGSTLLCSFMLHPDWATLDHRALLMCSRLLFIQQYRHRFAGTVISEIQGVSTEDAQSPFWDSLGAHFFAMSFAEADSHSAYRSKTFIAELMPPHPIYVPLLTPAAQRVIGVAHDQARVNIELMEREGFSKGPHIDIFDGGPTYECPVVRLSATNPARIKQVRFGGHSAGQTYLVANTSFQEFRCALVRFSDGLGDVIRIQETVAGLLGVKDGDAVIYVPFKSGGR
ncbi:MAG: arginine N-succinyltransferase [Pseudomonadales bacterium]|nr:arginine N-succinyltransferase [Pseudomonadales bacterium]